MKTGTGNVTVTNANNSQASILVGGGTLTGTTSSLNASSITNNFILTYDQSFNGTVAAPITGSGSLNKDGAGSVTLSGTNTYLGPTSILDGRLAIDGSITGITYVYSGATLGGHGTINGNVFSGGNVSPGNSIGTLTVNGTYDVLAGSTQTVEINDAGTTPGVNNDLLIVNGATSLQGGTVAVQAAPGTYTAGTKYTFLQANSISGQYAGITLSGFSTPMSAALGYESFGGFDFAFFTLMGGQTDFAAIAQTYNELQVADYLDDISVGATGEMRTILDEMQTLPVSEQRVALNQMTGVVNGTIAQLGVQDTTFMYMILRRRVGSAYATGGVIGAGEDSDWASADSSKSSSANILPVSYNPSTSGAASYTSSPVPQASVLRGTAGPRDTASAAAPSPTATPPAERTTRAARSWPWNARWTTTASAVSLARIRTSACRWSACRKPPRPIRVCSAAISSATLAKPMSWPPPPPASLATPKRDTSLSATSTRPLAANTAAGSRAPTSNTAAATRGDARCCSPTPRCNTSTCGKMASQKPVPAFSINPSAASTPTPCAACWARASQTWRTSTGRVWVPELRAVWMHEFLQPDTTLTAIFAPVGGSSFATRGLNFGRDWAVLGGGTQYVLNQNASLFANYDLLFNTQQAWHAGSGGVQFAW